ncbi:hypothetical protein AB1K54_08965 [Microbacterium sp. BWT-B31]|uniref:hypothetical protein n=1 Tax=Microbacterium sp. BWT-B31 TaxID=3232072 RepID=UPI003527149A
MRTTSGWTTAMLLGCWAAASVTGCSSAPAAPSEIREQLERNGEDLALPPLDLETMQWVNELDRALHGDPSFGAVAIDGPAVTITWYGPRSALLDTLIASAPDGLDVIVQPADFSPGELHDLVLAAMAPGAVPGVQLAMGHVRNDGSGLHFGIVELPPGVTEEYVAHLIGQAMGRSDVPITVEVSGAVMPVSG